MDPYNCVLNRAVPTWYKTAIDFLLVRGQVWGYGPVRNGFSLSSSLVLCIHKHCQTLGPSTPIFFKAIRNTRLIYSDGAGRWVRSLLTYEDFWAARKEVSPHYRYQRGFAYVTWFWSAFDSMDNNPSTFTKPPMPRWLGRTVTPV